MSPKSQFDSLNSEGESYDVGSTFSVHYFCKVTERSRFFGPLDLHPSQLPSERNTHFIVISVNIFANRPPTMSRTIKKQNNYCLVGSKNNILNDGGVFINI